MLHETRGKIIKLFGDYSLLASEAKYTSISRRRTPKQILQRLSMALAHVKAANTSEKLLNEIGQVIYSLCRTKEINKKCIIM